MFRNTIRRAKPDTPAAPFKSLSAPPEVRAVTDSEGLAVFHMGRGVIYKSNAVGACIWQALVERHSDADAVAEELKRRFAISAAQAQEDVSRFIGQLRVEGLVSDK